MTKVFPISDGRTWSLASIMHKGASGNTTTYKRLFAGLGCVMIPMGKQSKVHFLTGYLEYLYDEGIKSEYYYIGDASRFLRFLIQNSKPEDVEAFLATSASSAYRRRLSMTLRKFYAFAADRLDVTNNPFEESSQSGAAKR